MGNINLDFFRTVGFHLLSTFAGAPVGANQYLIATDQSLLFHTGMRQMVPLVMAGVSPTALSTTPAPATPRR